MRSENCAGEKMRSDRQLLYYSHVRNKPLHAIYHVLTLEAFRLFYT